MKSQIAQLSDLAKSQVLQPLKCKEISTAPKWLIVTNLGLMKRSEEDLPESSNLGLLFWEIKNTKIWNSFPKKFRLVKSFLFIFEEKKCMDMFSKCGSCPRSSYWMILVHARKFIVHVFCSDMVDPFPQGLCGLVIMSPLYSSPLICILAGVDLGSHIPFAGKIRFLLFCWVTCFSNGLPPSTQVKHWVILISPPSLLYVMRRRAVHERVEMVNVSPQVGSTS